MARRRRRRSYGSPPGEHRKTAARLVRTLHSQMARVRKNIREGNCKEALYYLASAANIGGAAYRERTGAGRPGRGTWQTVSRLRERFYKACVRGSTSKHRR